MNFRAKIVVQYLMKRSSLIRLIICLILCLCICIAAPCIVFKDRNGGGTAQTEKIVLRIWQIDNFEGGKGSRADFLQSVGNDFSEIGGSYVSVISLSAEAARLNLSEGNVPDLISYGAGIYGIESYISGYVSWCNGGYCILTLDTTADFSDINSENTVINSGKDNLVSAAALFCGVSGADYAKSTSAYVKLINGNYKYLLGTQRDIYRLKTRGVSFSIKPVTEFNDLYQNISVTATGDRAKLAQRFIDYLMTRLSEVNRIGMLSGKTSYDDEMKSMLGLDYEYKLTSPISAETKNQLESIIKSSDINMLKNLLK